jgi:hypothetical protein
MALLVQLGLHLFDEFGVLAAAGSCLALRLAACRCAGCRRAFLLLG